MTLEERIRSKHQGIPGLGVNASSGQEGRRGPSIYIGHVKDFFDVINLKEEEGGYIRIKNQKHYRLPESKQFYYKKQSNFYRNLADEVDRMTTFSVYNLHGMYLTTGQHNGLDVGANDFARFGWTLDLYKLIKKAQMRSPYGSPDPAVTKFKEWLTSKTSEELRELEGKLFIKDSEANSEEDDTDSSMYFKYVSLNRSMIDDPTYPNPYSAEDFDNAVFNISLGDHTDENGVDVGGIDYLNERELNQESTNYNNRYTSDIIIPTNLSSKYKEGDILYFLDDITNEIMSYVVVTSDMVQCRYDYFLGISTITIKALTSVFKETNRVGAYKNIILSDLEVSSLLSQFKNNAVDNFIKKYDDNYALSIDSNKRDTINWMLLNTTDNNVFELKSVRKTPESQTSSFNVSTKNIKFDNIWMKNIWTNVNIPEYFNSNIVLVDGLHIDNIDEREFIDDYQKIVVSSSKFFYSSKEGDEFGVIIMDNSGRVLKTYSYKDNGSYTISYVEDLNINEHAVLKIMTYANEYNTTRYYSEISEIDIDPVQKIAVYMKNESEEEIQELYDNGHFIFHSSDLTCEKCDFRLIIEPSDGVEFKQVFLNEVPIYQVTNSWISLRQVNGNISGNQQVELVFNVANNIPNDNNENQDSIAEYLLSVSQTKEIGDIIEETKSRSVVITAIGEKDGEIVRTSHKVVQPGFENPLKDITIGFNNLIDNNAIEESNSSESGVLCNQIQLFTELVIDGFDNSKWATYLEDPKLYVYINIDNDIDNKTDTDETNFNNVHFYSINDKNKFTDNAVKMKFSWIPNTQGTTHDSSLADIESVERELPGYSYVFGDINDALHTDTEWVYFSDSSFLYNRDTYIPKDIIYRLNDESYIGGISLAEATSQEKIMIRTIAEVANPVPMEFNIKWIVEKIEVRGKVKAGIRPDSDEWEEQELVFSKKYMDELGYTYNPISENMKFIINPVYMTICPEDTENITGQKVGVAIMNVGPEDEPIVEVGIQDIDQDAKDEFFLQKRYDIPENRLKESRGNYNYVSDITYYWPKKRYLQDNIQNIYIKPRDLKNDVRKNIITKKNSAFVNLIDNLKSKESILQNMYNISLLDFNDSINEDYEKSYLMSVFNGYVMNPEYRNENLTFYYNGKLYKEDLYDQWNSVSPLWSQQETTIEVVDSSLLDAKHNWNYEYEVSKDYVKDKTFGGVVTKSGYGYLELASENSIEKYDSGQYDVIGALGLRETIEKSEEPILPEPSITPMVLPSGFVKVPNQGEFFRTMLYDMKWIYPYYINKNNTLMVYPYYFANSYEAWLDAEVMRGFLDTRINDSLAELNLYINNSEVLVNEDVRKNYIDMKFDDSLYFMKNNYLLFENNAEKTKINMMIPYNICYDIYPRTMYNTDRKNTINVFMLQQPSITRTNSYNLDKHYFNVPPFSDDEEEKSYYENNFEPGRQVVAPILPPWYFNK